MHRAHPSLVLAVVALGAVLPGAGCSGDAVAPLPDGGVRVLFVGNSLTYENNLPRTIADLAKSVNDTPLVYRTVAKPNYSIEDHYNDGIDRAIEGNGWHLVIMQQGPTTSAAGSAHLTIFTGAMDALASAAGARIAMYQVWPAFGDPVGFAASREAYRGAAVSVDGMFIPAGEAWLEAWSRDPALALYASDHFHPSSIGTYLAALVHFEMLYDRPATDLPDVAYVNGRRLDLPVTTVALLQEAAHAAVLAWGIP